MRFSGLFQQLILQSGSSLCTGSVSNFGAKKKESDQNGQEVIKGHIIKNRFLLKKQYVNT
jgi:hypothetical protein